MERETEKFSGGEEAEKTAKRRLRERQLAAIAMGNSKFLKWQQKAAERCAATIEERRKIDPDSAPELVGNTEAEKQFDAMMIRYGRFFDYDKEHDAGHTKKVLSKMAERGIVAPENILDSYWEKQEQILRDNGNGHKLSSEEKERLVDGIQELQRESIQPWVDYLSDKDAPYPAWFKVYAMDGLLSLGTYDKDKGKFRKRNESTVAPYPHLNAAALSKVYEHFVDIAKAKDDKDRYVKIDPNQLQTNFNGLYSSALEECQTTIHVPDNPNDPSIKDAMWITYRPGEEDSLAAAAQGTPWCIIGAPVGRSYLNYGKYGEDNATNPDSKARFILLHLDDLDRPGTYSDTACASIRLDPNGNVAEISGIENGQDLSDSLVQKVTEKVKSLPGGEDYLEQLHDKQQLITLNAKMQAGDDLTKEELEFLYEIHRPIKTQAKYVECDPRISELRQEYGVDYALDHGVELDALVKKLEPWDILENFDTLKSHGADIDVNKLAHELEPYDIARNLDTLKSHGANIDVYELANELGPSDVVYYLDTLKSHGANIDVNELVKKLEPWDVASNLDTLISHGANIDANELANKLEPSDVAYYLDTLKSHGANIDANELVNKLKPSDIMNNLDTLTRYGANIDVYELANELTPLGVAGCLDTLISHGANINKLANKLEPRLVVRCLGTLISHGANIDFNKLAKELEPRDVAHCLDTLISHDANIDVNELVNELEPRDIRYNFDTLTRHGAAPERLRAIIANR